METDKIVPEYTVVVLQLDQLEHDSDPVANESEKAESHVEDESLEKKYSCTYCNKQYTSHSHLLRHQKTFHGVRLKSKHSRKKEKQHWCDLCRKRFMYHYLVLRHKKLVHGVITPKSEKKKCSQCFSSALPEQVTPTQKGDNELLDRNAVRNEQKENVSSSSNATFEIATLENEANQNDELRESHCTLKTYNCPNCSASYATLGGLNKHKKNIHNIEFNYRGSLKCSECLSSYATTKLFMEHLTQLHADIVLKAENLSFQSVEDFDAWKEQLEKDTASIYIKKNRYSTPAGMLQYYVCHRSGQYKHKGNWNRLLKVDGTKKTGFFCPARIKATTCCTSSGDTRVDVVMIATHVGHECALGHFALSKAQKKLVRLEALSSRHKLAEEQLHQTMILSTEENVWMILSAANASDSCEIRRAELKLGHKCRIICQVCNACIHQFRCTCSDGTVNFCKHIHMLCMKIGVQNMVIEPDIDHGMKIVSCDLETCEVETSELEAHATDNCDVDTAAPCELETTITNNHKVETNASCDLETQISNCEIETNIDEVEPSLNYEVVCEVETTTTCEVDTSVKCESNCVTNNNCEMNDSSEIEANVNCEVEEEVNCKASSVNCEMKMRSNLSVVDGNCKFYEPWKQCVVMEAVQTTDSSDPRILKEEAKLAILKILPTLENCMTNEQYVKVIHTMTVLNNHLEGMTGDIPTEI